MSLKLNQLESRSLSFFPWKFIQIDSDSDDDDDDDGGSGDNIQQQQQQQQQQQKHELSSTSSTLKILAPWNYLSLRHEQNTKWAQSQFERGVKFAKSALALQQEQQQQSQFQPRTATSAVAAATAPQDLIQKAEKCYKQGLELIPHHVGILTAYSALCINDLRYEKAKSMLLEAICHYEDSKGNDSKSTKRDKEGKSSSDQTGNDNDVNSRNSDIEGEDTDKKRRQKQRRKTHSRRDRRTSSSSSSTSSNDS